MHDRARSTAKVFDLAFAYPVLPFAQIPGAAEGLNGTNFLTQLLYITVYEFRTLITVMNSEP